MKRIAALTITLTLLALPLQAQENDDGLSLMERGALLFFEGIMKEMEPALEELDGMADQLAPALRNFAQEMGPKLTDLMEEVEDWSAYEAPEVLPNGDIIIRRKPSPPQEQLVVPGDPAPQIDL